MVASPVHAIDDLLNWPHLQARGMIVDVEHPTLGRLNELKAAGFPLRFSASETRYDPHAAASGSHTAQVLRDWLGIRADELDELAAHNII